MGKFGYIAAGFAIGFLFWIGILALILKVFDYDNPPD